MNPIAVFRYAGDGPNGLGRGFGDRLDPHTQTAEKCGLARKQGWRICKHRPLGEPQLGDAMDADTPADQIDAGNLALVADFLANAHPDDLHYWGTVSSGDLAALWDSGNWPEFYRRLALTCLVIKRAGGTPILDAAGASDHPANLAWVEMVRACGVEPILEPWTVGGGFALERWIYRGVLLGAEGYGHFGKSDNEPAIRWWSGHTLADGSLPWGGNVRHWLQHVEAHGHTAAFNVEDIDLSITADEFVERVARGKA